MVPLHNPSPPLPTTAVMGLLPVAQVQRGSADYPERLMDLHRAPATLWYQGALPGRHERRVAIVGSRAATRRGTACATRLASELGRAGWAVVSGGAFGIDAAAHEGALQTRALTYAVLGCGVDVVYPDRHGPLFERVAGQGGLLTEYAPGTPPRSGQFPARNRIIAALAQAVWVVEAAHRSGALSTAREARKLRRPVLAVPGSQGTDALIAQGLACAAEEPAQLLDVLAGIYVPPVPEPPRLSPEVAAVVGALKAGPLTCEALAAHLSLPLPALLSVLTQAEIEGWVRRLAGSHYEVSRGH